jgi:putative transposase
MMESFNGQLRDECLNDHEFVSLDDVRATLSEWREVYNHLRPHSSLGHRTPGEFVRRGQQPDSEAARF